MSELFPLYENGSHSAHRNAPSGPYVYVIRDRDGSAAYVGQTMNENGDVGRLHNYGSGAGLASKVALGLLRDKNASTLTRDELIEAFDYPGVIATFRQVV